MSIPLLRGRHKRRSKFDLFDYWSITLPDGGKTGLKYSIARNVVVLAVDMVTYCCTVASRLNFDVKSATQGVIIHSCNLRMSIKQTLL